MNIPLHVRENYEATESKLADLGALLNAAGQMFFEAEIPITPETDAAFVLLRMAQEMHKEARRAHLAEWVGHGGNSDGLTEAEITAARGETGRAAA